MAVKFLTSPSPAEIILFAAQTIKHKVIIIYIIFLLDYSVDCV